MANVLAELFGNIATEIKNKTGRQDKIKPINFPTEIASIVTGGGESSAVVSDKWIGEMGEFSTEESTYTVEHKLGKIPDIVFILASFSGTLGELNNTYLVMVFATSENLLGKAVNMGSESLDYGGAFRYNPSLKRFINTTYTSGLENFDSTYPIYATSTTIKFGASFQELYPNLKYSWGAYAKRELSGDYDDLIKYVTFIGGNGEELAKVSVVIGDDCPDPVANGTIDTPTKESTVDKVFTFSGWSLTEGGSANSTALSNVTKDRTVYVAFKESVRKYAVRFYDGDTLIKTEQVAYGGSSSYDYDIKEGYVFTGWNPSPTNITGDMDCYAVFEEATSFADMTWDKIASISERGLAEEFFSLGDKKTIAIKYYNSARTIDVDVQIVAFNHDTTTSGDKAGITVVSVPALQWDIMDSDIGFNSNAVDLRLNGTWSDSELRYWLNTGFAAEFLPVNLLNHIKYVVKTQKEYPETIKQTNDRVFVPSTAEILGNYPYFVSTGDRTKKFLDGTSTKYGLRDSGNLVAGYNTAEKHQCIQEDGRHGEVAYDQNSTVFPFAFCI